MTKTRAGRFFEDYTVGQLLTHAVPRTVGEGERALNLALYPTRFALPSSDEFAAAANTEGHQLAAIRAIDGPARETLVFDSQPGAAMGTGELMHESGSSDPDARSVRVAKVWATAAE